MSKRAWFAAIAFGLIITLSGWYGWHQVRIYQIEKTDQRQSVAEADARNVYECFNRFEFPSLVACVYDVSQADAETERSNYDLQAQQEMAEWAFALLLVSVAGTVLSVFGLATLLYSLKLTRDAVEITRLHGQIELRAYLKVDIEASIIDRARNTDPPKFRCRIRVSNSGTTPALEVVNRMTVWVLNDGEIGLGPIVCEIQNDGPIYRGEITRDLPAVFEFFSTDPGFINFMPTHDSITTTKYTDMIIRVEAAFRDVFDDPHTPEYWFGGGVSCLGSNKLERIAYPGEKYI